MRTSIEETSNVLTENAKAPLDPSLPGAGGSYSLDELSLIRRFIIDNASNPKFHAELSCNFLGLFDELKKKEEGLALKLVNDSNLKTFSIFGFFPAVFPMVYRSPEEHRPSSVRFIHSRDRGIIAFIAGDLEVVIKRECNSREAEISRLAFEAGRVGPQPLDSLSGYITELVIPGSAYTELPAAMRSPESLYEIGQNLRRAIDCLHARGIFYNDILLEDTSGRSNVIVMPDKSVRIIDFGRSIIVRPDGAYSVEERKLLCELGRFDYNNVPPPQVILEEDYNLQSQFAPVDPNLLQGFNSLDKESSTPR